ncbi:zinc finger-containing ubiquitin peptidase 1 [Sarcophilus harrisii]|uniref:Zinc finger-containing ubiquitin peptidase 1 n=1 Tax=Sarcophilus harrisii TaxID=9305 RepID=G3WXM5_SARHA|nr:zinc finger-containing ubiquitin peptidase 1 [Sarcophilus harrisii]
MFTCDICGELVASEQEMKTHLLLIHMENEVVCPFCKLSGINYDEMCFHIETAHFEQNENEKDLKKVNPLQHRTLDRKTEKENSHHYRMEVNEDVYSACASNDHSHSKAVSLKCKTFHSEDLTELREFQENRLNQSDLTEINESLSSIPECPFCGKLEACNENLETHVKKKHANLLDTPAEGQDQPFFECPICGLICTNYQILHEHIDLHLEEGHFEGINKGSNDLELAHQLQKEEDRQGMSERSRQEKEEFQKLQRQYGLDNSGGYKQQQLRNMEIEVHRGRMQPIEFHKRKADLLESLAFGIDDGKTRTSGIIEALYRHYQNEAREMRRVWLSTGVDHFYSSLGDKGWGCGYRNFQMLLSSLLQNDSYKDCLKDMSIPCIPKIQSMIEDAWKEGFDPQGASQLNNRLQGTRAWIGACEIYSLLTSLRLKCRIIDFHKPTGPLGTHPRLFDWILNYYSSGREGGPKVVCSSKPPIYLQHQGHSRTIIGIEERKNRTLCLLIFDPGCPSWEMQKLLKQDIEGTSLKQLWRFVGNLKHKQYQIVAVEGVLSPEEKIARMKASQIFTAERIP